MARRWACCRARRGASSTAPGGVVAPRAGGALPFLHAELDLTPPLPPVAIAHGTADAVAPVFGARNARTTLAAAGASVLYLETPIDHEPDAAVIPDLRAFLAQVAG